MTHLLHSPELEAPRHQDRFDPVIEGARYRLSQEVALAIWAYVCAGATDHIGRRDEVQAWRHFHELAARIAARGGLLQPDVGKATRVGIEIEGISLNTWKVDELRHTPTPGKQTLTGWLPQQRQGSAELIETEDSAQAPPFGRVSAATTDTGRPTLQMLFGVPRHSTATPAEGHEPGRVRQQHRDRRRRSLQLRQDGPSPVAQRPVVNIAFFGIDTRHGRQRDRALVQQNYEYAEALARSLPRGESRVKGAHSLAEAIRFVNELVERGYAIGNVYFVSHGGPSGILLNVTGEHQTPNGLTISDAPANAALTPERPDVPSQGVRSRELLQLIGANAAPGHNEISLYGCYTGDIHLLRAVADSYELGVHSAHGSRGGVSVSVGGVQGFFQTRSVNGGQVQARITTEEDPDLDHHTPWQAVVDGVIRLTGPNADRHALEIEADQPEVEERPIHAPEGD